MSELSSVVALITDMRTEQKEASRTTDENLGKLRETMHKLANDMVGVSQLATIVHGELTELKKKQSDDISAVHGHIDRETKELSITLEKEVGKLEAKRDDLLGKWETRIAALECGLVSITPPAVAFGKLRDNANKAIVTVLIGVLFAAIVFFGKDKF